ncbi:putative S-adenosyl-L-methionine-dependent methyltransferase [Dillenia turbinata]|uniref:Methyltransferase n=1 Tax=Dillenia turbinata TaxID=194707 RepID=A0AAN8UMQ1_9MAGN
MAWNSKPPNSLRFKIKSLISQLKKLNLYYITAVVILCSLSYLFGIWQPHTKPFTASNITTAPCTIQSINATSSSIITLDFTSHHSAATEVSASAQLKFTRKKQYPVCNFKYSEHTPCEDTERSLKFSRERLIYRERHCPDETEGRLKCRVPAPHGYKTPFPWPVSRDYAWYANVPHKWLTVEKGGQNWVRFKGDRFRFPGGGTMFPRGANAYIDEIGKLINLKDGSVRTAIDTGCGVASWGGYLLSRDILPLSFAPKDTHEAQVQFALERGIPALLGVLASNRLPYPSRAFDMAHCSRCLIPWGQYEGVYLMEVDRILRPGGYWILSGPPINWETHWKGWQRTREDLKAEQDGIERLARSLCWKKLVQRNDLAIWQKPSNHIHCKINRKVFKFPLFCSSQDPDQAWYTKMDTCLTPLPEASEIKEVAGGQLAKWPERLHAIPPRISSGSLNGITAETFRADSELWKKRVSYYKSLNNQLAQPGKYRNLLDMNAYLGGFAAALIGDPVWVMNVVPVEAKINTLGVVYERGLIGSYQNWCEAMSTYPRTYDFIHANSVFTLYDGRCEMEDILLEMDRILRPEGCVIFRDDVDVLVKIKDIIDEFDWDSRIVDHEDGPLEREKLLVAVKLYWTAPAPDSKQNGSSDTASN